MSFDLNELDSAETAEMMVHVHGSPTYWVWLFAGPGHPKAVAQDERVSRERLNRSKRQEEARVNGKKWKGDDESPDEVLDRSVRFVTERLVDWYMVDPDTGERTNDQVLLSGKPFPFSEDNARTLLMDRNKATLLEQAIEFLSDSQSFTPRSATTSTGSQSASSPSPEAKTDQATEKS